MPFTQGDDACSLKLPGPAEGVDVVASGTREAGIAPLSGTGPHLAFDGLVGTTWTAQCGAGSRANEVGMGLGDMADMEDGLGEIC